HGVIALAQVSIEPVAVNHLFAGPQVLKRTVDPMGVDAVNRLTHAVFYHEAENQPFDVGVDVDGNPESDRCTCFQHINVLALIVEQCDVSDAGFASARDGANAIVRWTLLSDGALF